MIHVAEDDVYNIIYAAKINYVCDGIVKLTLSKILSIIGWIK